VLSVERPIFPILFSNVLMKNQFLILFSAFLFVVGAGCGNRSSQLEGRVTGKVTLADEPVTSGLVEFFSSATGTGAVAKIGSDGSYAIETPLRVGEYSVTVQGPIPEPGQPAVPPTKIPRKYWKANTSELTKSVVVGKNTIDLPLSLQK